MTAVTHESVSLICTSWEFAQYRPTDGKQMWPSHYPAPPQTMLWICQLGFPVDGLQLPMDFLSMNYLLMNFLLILKCQNQCYTGWFFLTAPPAPKSSKCQITWEMPNQITCLSFGVSIWNPSLQTFVCKSKKFLVPKSMSMITKFEKFSWHLSPVKSPYQNACTSMVAGPFAVICSCLQEQKVLNAISCIIL